MATPATQTAGAAPPSFYNLAAKGNSGPAAGAGSQTQGQAGPAGAGQAQQAQAQPDPDQQFLEMVTKLLGIMSKLSVMTPRGQDITKGMNAASNAVKQVVESVFDNSGGGQAAGSQGQTGNGGNQPASSSGGPGGTMAGADGGGPAGAMGAAA